MTDRQYVIPTGPGMGRGLVNHDDRSRNFRAVDLTAATKLQTRHWRRAAAYDQGRTSECVAYTGKGILNSQPLAAGVLWSTRSHYSPDTFYAGAQANDQWAGNAYDGTSGLGLCRYLKGAGLIREYRWCFGLDDVLVTLSHIGPVGIGIKWTEGMFDPDARGFIRPTGSEAGGHEIEVSGIDVKLGAVIVTNSWGKSWGRNGRAWLTFDDLGTLLAADGDAFVVTA